MVTVIEMEFYKSQIQATQELKRIADSLEKVAGLLEKFYEGEDN